MTAAPPKKIPFRRKARAHAAALKLQDQIAKRHAEREAKRRQDTELGHKEASAADAKVRAALTRKAQRMKEFAARRARELQPPVQDRFPKIKNDGVGGHAQFICRETFSRLGGDTQRRLLAASMCGTPMADVERARSLLDTDPDLLSARVRAEILSRANKEHHHE
jgi:hypothetical protein